jgi:ornithine cyclodeaminase/alanine dehydrogenase-like protein (mu-crystallin family)
VLIISEEEVERLLKMDDLLAAMQKALIEFSAGRVVQPVRSVVRVADYEGWLGLMPAVYGEVMGTKLVTVFPRNVSRGLHTHNALIQLFRTETGEPLATMGGRVITALRTAAVSALATQSLAPRHPAQKDGGVLAVLGSGVQARSHHRALSLVRRFDEIRIWSRTPENAIRCANEIGATHAETAQEAVLNADLVITATSSTEPVLHGAWLKSGALVIAVGAVGLQARELDDEAMLRGAVIVDSREAAMHESGDVVNSRARICAELGEILARTAPKPDSEITVFKSLGIAVEDIAAAKLVFDRYEQTASR